MQIRTLFWTKGVLFYLAQIRYDRGIRQQTGALFRKGGCHGEVLSCDRYRRVERASHTVAHGKRKDRAGGSLSLPKRHGGVPGTKGLGCRRAVCGNQDRNAQVRGAWKDTGQLRD